MKNTLIVAVILAFSISFVQAQSIKIVDGVSLIGRDTAGVTAWAKSRDYHLVRSRVADFLHFVHVTSLGTQELDVAIKNRKISAVSWSEHLMYISTLVGDAGMLDGFNRKQQVNSRVLPFENEKKGLLLNLITQQEENQIKIVVGKSQ